MKGFCFGSRSLLLALAVFMGLAGCACCQDLGSTGFAAHLNATNRFHHADGYHGAEVIYRSSGVATEQAAIAKWMRSRDGHRELLQSGAITEISCVGGVCVGRGPAMRSSTVSRTYTRNSFGLLPLRRR